VKIVQTGTSDYKELVNIRGANAGWVGESGARTATQTSQLREVAPTMGELYAYPQASEWSLDDMFFNVEEWLSNEVADAFSIQEGDAVIRGNGSSKPTGMLNSVPTTADDASFGEPPTRAAAVYQYISNAGSPNELDGDLLLSLIYKLNAVYRANATFVMNSVTTGHIRKLKDANGVYLWAPGLQAGQPDRLLGFQVEIWEQMDDVGSGAGNFPVAFGDFKRGYVLTDRVGMRITRDNVTNVGFVRFYVRRREGGIVLNNDAIKWLRT
jgi:HK97 family phage major capsid protein